MLAMEEWSSLCFVALPTLLALWFLKLTGELRSKKSAKKQLPPGPWTLPIIGSLHHLLVGLPHRTLAQLSRRHGPLMHLRLGEVPVVVVSSAEAAALVMKTNDLSFASRPRSTTTDIVSCCGKGIIFSPYGDPWRQMRKLVVVELLSAKQVQRMEGIRADMVENLLRSVAAGHGAMINFSAKVAALGNNIVSQAVFGGRCPRQDEFLCELDNVLALLGGFSLVDMFPSSRLVRWFSNGERNMSRSYGRIQRIFDGIMDGRRAARASGQDEDLLDVLLRLQEEDTLAFPLTTEIIGVVVFDMFAAATESSGTTLEWAMSELLRNPKAMSRVQKEVREGLGQDRAVIINSDLSELPYMQMVIKEVLRLHPPAPMLAPREAREDCEIMGYHMPKGTNVYVNAFGISRDPRYWDNPEEFKPDRFENNIDYYGTNFEFTPFGAGRRQCPGILFGISTIEIALANLLYHFDWFLPNGVSLETLDMSEKFGIAIGRRSDLQLIAFPHPGSKATSI